MTQGLRDWIPMLFQSVLPWMSAADIHPGRRWAHELADSLSDTRMGIICLTRENLFSPWVLFEAGSLANAVPEGRVIPYLLGLPLVQLSGPLAQFQGVEADREGTRRVAIAIADALSVNSRSPRALDTLFDRLWPLLEETLEKARSLSMVEHGSSDDTPTVSMSALSASFNDFAASELSTVDGRPLQVGDAVKAISALLVVGADVGEIGQAIKDAFPDLRRGGIIIPDTTDWGRKLGVPLCGLLLRKGLVFQEGTRFILNDTGREFLNHLEMRPNKALEPPGADVRCAPRLSAGR